MVKENPLALSLTPTLRQVWGACFAASYALLYNGKPSPLADEDERHAHSDWCAQKAVEQASSALESLLLVLPDVKEESGDAVEAVVAGVLGDTYYLACEKAIP